MNKQRGFFVFELLLPSLLLSFLLLALTYFFLETQLGWRKAITWQNSLDQAHRSDRRQANRKQRCLDQKHPKNFYPPLGMSYDFDQSLFPQVFRSQADPCLPHIRRHY
jgi:hypothetical protein